MTAGQWLHAQPREGEKVLALAEVVDTDVYDETKTATHTMVTIELADGWKITEDGRIRKMVVTTHG